MKLFSHPNKVCMTYFQHMRLSLYFSSILMLGSIQSIVHAFLPDIYITSTTDLTRKLKLILDKSGCHKKSGDIKNDEQKY